jgi:hypothetical protein
VQLLYAILIHLKNGRVQIPLVVTGLFTILGLIRVVILRQPSATHDVVEQFELFVYLLVRHLRLSEFLLFKLRELLELAIDNLALK